MCMCSRGASTAVAIGATSESNRALIIGVLCSRCSASLRACALKEQREAASDALCALGYMRRKLDGELENCERSVRRDPLNAKYDVPLSHFNEGVEYMEP